MPFQGSEWARRRDVRRRDNRVECKSRPSSARRPTDAIKTNDIDSPTRRSWIARAANLQKKLLDTAVAKGPSPRHSAPGVAAGLSNRHASCFASGKIPPPTSTPACGRGGRGGRGGHPDDTGPTRAPPTASTPRESSPGSSKVCMYVRCCTQRFMTYRGCPRASSPAARRSTRPIGGAIDEPSADCGPSTASSISRCFLIRARRRRHPPRQPLTFATPRWARSTLQWQPRTRYPLPGNSSRRDTYSTS